MLTDKGDIENRARGYFLKLFATNSPREIDAVLEDLEGPYEEEEVLSALKQMHPLKAPRSDGMCAMFFPVVLGCGGTQSDGDCTKSVKLRGP
ncbi:hypothetical protein V2J09_015905 [Rumex salicifolius]